MAHNIARDIKTGKDMCFTAGKLPWHNLGQNVAEAQTWEQAIKLAGLDWTVLSAPLYTNWSKSGLIEVPDMQALVRADTKQTLGIHTKGYQIFQNVEAFQFADALIEGGAQFDTAGGLGIGQRIWCLVRIPQADFEVGNGDKHEMYLLVVTSHDGSIAFTALVTDVRAVCQNTVNMALGSDASRLKIRHTKSGDARIQEAKRLISGTVQSAESLRDKLNQLAQVRLTKETYTAIVDKLFPIDTTAKTQTRRENMLAEILLSYEANDGNMFPDQRGTAYNLLNAITDYTDHLRGTRKSDETKTADYARSESALFGSGAKLKEQALEVIYQTSGAANVTGPSRTYSAQAQAQGNGGGGVLDDILAAV